MKADKVTSVFCVRMASVSSRNSQTSAKALLVGGDALLSRVAEKAA